MYKVKATDHDPHWYTLWVKKAIHRRPHSYEVDRGSVIETEAWMPTIKSLHSQVMPNGAYERTTQQLSERVLRIEMHQGQHFKKHQQ